MIKNKEQRLQNILKALEQLIMKHPKLPNRPLFKVSAKILKAFHAFWKNLLPYLILLVIGNDPNPDAQRTDGL